MRQYTNRSAAATRPACNRVRRNPKRLPLEAFREAQRVHAGELHYGETWDALFLAATAAGVGHLDAQEIIGRQFRLARLFPLEGVAA